MKKKSLVNLLIATAAVSLNADEGTLVLDTHYELLNNYWLNCHDEVEMKGDVNLDRSSINWSKKEERNLWTNARYMLQEGLMPPEEEKDQPSDVERASLIDWLDASLIENTSFGGTLARRLSKEEYQNTIRIHFDLPHYKVPLGFPEDSTRHGFNNTGDGLILSPTLLESYFNIANQVADEIFPAKKMAPESSFRVVEPKDMVANYAAAAIYDNTLRFASSGTQIMRSCSWPKRLTIDSSGVYKITVSASSFLPRSRNLMKEGPMLLELRARDLRVGERAQIDRFRLLKTISVSSESPQEVSFEAELYEGETVLFYWNNSPLSYGGGDNGEFGKHVRKRFEKDKRVLAAWQKVILDNSHDPKEGTLFNYGDLRGISGWERFKKAIQDKDLDMSHATMDSAQTEELIALFAFQGNVLGEAFVYDYFEKGPALDLHGFSVEGPLRSVDGPKDKAIKDRQQRLFGVRDKEQSKEESAGIILKQLLPKLFRRPVESDTIDAYLQIATEHWAKGHSYEDGLHLLIRSILMSPRFLYRTLDQGPTNDYDIATRLSYFLTQGPPDNTLVELAAAGKLSDSEVLKEQALRLLPKNAQSPMVQSFSSQWLSTKRLDSIMPDPKFNFTANDTDLAKREVEHFFAAMLKENRPMADFIDPGFTFTTPEFAERIYQKKSEKKIDNNDSENEFQRITLKRDGRYGGLLGMSAVMTATANGVDTQPVLRGVWVLENILGLPVPKPPENVPALTPDTQGAETPRELLAAHTNSSSCMKCHKKIDPLGFLLENFDPVGQWRDKWPKSGKFIDASATLQDRSKIEDVIGLKRWMVSNIDLFSKCLAVKLMIYATGREPSYIEVKEIEGIVKTNLENNEGFQDLFLDLILSKTFRSK